MSLESTRAAMLAYLQHDDFSKVAEDAVYTEMATGEEYRGREAIARMITHLYEEAFTATARMRSLIVTEDHAVLEADFVGTQHGAFHGIPARAEEVRVPLCVVYDLADDQIVRARIYFETDVLRGAPHS